MNTGTQPYCRTCDNGGAHSAFNLVPSCSSCNCHKQAQDPNKFIKEGQLILVF